PRAARRRGATARRSALQPSELRARAREQRHARRRRAARSPARPQRRQATDAPRRRLRAHARARSRERAALRFARAGPSHPARAAVALRRLDSVAPSTTRGTPDKERAMLRHITVVVLIVAAALVPAAAFCADME